MLHYTVNQRPHWACRQYGHSVGTRGCLGVKRCQLCLQDASHSALSSSGSLGFIVYVKSCKMVDSVPKWQLFLSSQYIHTICRSQINRRSDGISLGLGTFSWQDPVNSWKVAPGEV